MRWVTSLPQYTGGETESGGRLCEPWPWRAPAACVLPVKIGLREESVHSGFSCSCVDAASLGGENWGGAVRSVGCAVPRLSRSLGLPRVATAEERVPVCTVAQTRVTRLWFRGHHLCRGRTHPDAAGLLAPASAWKWSRCPVDPQPGCLHRLRQFPRRGLSSTSSCADLDQTGKGAAVTPEHGDARLHQLRSR